LFITALTAMPISFTSVRESLYAMTSSQRLTKSVSTVVPGAPRVSLESNWSNAQLAFPAAEEGVMRIPRQADDAVEIFTIDAGAAHPNARNYIYFDAYSGKLLKAIPYAQSPMGLRLYFWIVSLHTGAVGGPIVQVLFLLGMLGVPVLAYTGFASYLSRRAQAAAQPEPALARVMAIRDETEEIKSFRLARADGKALKPFDPGTHISLQNPDR